MASVIAYVDGFNLYHGLHDKFRHRYLWLDLERLVQRLRPKDQIIKVNYFTATLLNDPQALARQQTYLDALQAHSGGAMEITLGRYQHKTMTCRQCNGTWSHYEEKETDVNIAVSLVADAALGASDIALIVSADSDLCPAIRRARSLNPQRGMVVAFPPKRSSFEIRSVIRNPFTISNSDLRNSLLPPSVTDAATGQLYARPPKWV